MTVVHFGTTRVICLRNNLSWHFASNGPCPSDPTVPFEVEDALERPLQPVVTTTAQNCSGNGAATITNYNFAFDYVFTPSGPVVSGTGQIIGLVAGQFYTVIATNGDCESIASLPFFINPSVSSVLFI